MLGHSSVQLTLDTYSHLLPDLKLKERAAARLDALLRDDADNCGQNYGQDGEKVVSRLGIVHVWRARRAKPTWLGSRRRNQAERSEGW